MNSRPIRSIRTIFAALEGITLFVAILFVVVLFTLIGREIKSSYFKSQSLEVDKVETTILNFIERNRGLFAVFARVPDKGAASALCPASPTSISAMADSSSRVS